jgi:hypothetical protein
MTTRRTFVQYTAEWLLWPRATAFNMAALMIAARNGLKHEALLAVFETTQPDPRLFFQDVQVGSEIRPGFEWGYQF